MNESILRTIFLETLSARDDTYAALPRGDFLAMLPAYSTDEIALSLAVARMLIKLDCCEFCCVGPNSEQLHEELDIELEDEGRISIVTTSFTHEEEACEYFIFGATGGTASIMLCLVADHVDIVSVLLQLIESMSRVKLVVKET